MSENVINTERLTLRPVLTGDTDEIHRYAGDKSIDMMLFLPNPTEHVSSLRSVKVATHPCDACASIPCGLAVRKQHEMLFAASKFGKTNTENQTVWP